MFAPDGQGPAAWRALTGEAAAGLERGSYRIVARAETGGEGSSLVVDRAERTQGFANQEAAGPAALGIDFPLRADLIVAPTAGSDPCNFPQIVGELIDNLYLLEPAIYHAVFGDPNGFPIAITSISSGDPLSIMGATLARTT